MKRRKFVQTTILGTGSVLFARNLMASVLNNKHMKLTMIYNNIAGNTDLISEWGLSVWIDYGDKAILFDTGGEEKAIVDNIRLTGLDYKKLSAIVISHNHGDHTGGLPAVLEKTGYNIPVYVPGNASGSIQKKNPKADIKGVDKPVQITGNIWTTGQMKSDYRSGYIYEQSLLLSNNGGMAVITGCSHPGIVEIVKKAKEINPDDKIKLTAGGFHLLRHSKDAVKDISDELKELGVQNIAPSHCTGDDAINIFRQEWGDNFADFNLGDTYSI